MSGCPGQKAQDSEEPLFSSEAEPLRTESSVRILVSTVRDSSLAKLSLEQFWV